MRIYDKASAASVAIRKFEERDIPSKVRWINDEANNRYLHYELPLEEEKTLAWFRKNQNRQDRYDAVIEWASVHRKRPGRVLYHAG